MSRTVRGGFRVDLRSGWIQQAEVLFIQAKEIGGATQ